MLYNYQADTLPGSEDPSKSSPNQSVKNISPHLPSDDIIVATKQYLNYNVYNISP